MRVTKAIKEYIEKSVRAKVDMKYADLRAERKSQDEIRQKIYEQAEKAYNDTLCNLAAEHDFLEVQTSRYRDLMTIDLETESAVANWHRDAHNETREKMQEIIVTLELGGNKEDLDRMLAEI